MHNSKTADAGYSLVELLVAMMLSGIALSVMATDFSHTVQQRHQLNQVAEAQQGVSAAITFVSQELRQAGACLPALGEFLALDGENDGNQDTLRLRIGRIRRDSMTCIRTVTVTNAVAGDSTLQVQDIAGFDVGQYIYVTRTGGRGKTFVISDIDETVETITIEGSLDGNYQAGGGVYAIEERTYAIDGSGAEPILTVAVDDGEPEPFARGIEVFDIRYRLGDCVDCGAVDLPADGTEWRLVREVELTVASRSRATQQNGAAHVVRESTTIKPRNLL